MGPPQLALEGIEHLHGLKVHLHHKNMSQRVFPLLYLGRVKVGAKRLEPPPTPAKLFASSAAPVYSYSPMYVDSQRGS